MHATIAPMRLGLDVNPVKFMWTSRMTHSDVMAVTCTVKELVEDTSRRSVNSEMRRINIPFSETVTQLSVPVERKNKALWRERERFMYTLAQERKDRVELETWGATKIQAVYRGFLVRPKPYLAIVRQRQRVNNKDKIRNQLASLRAEIDKNMKKDESDDESMPEWRRAVKTESTKRRKEKRLARNQLAGACIIQSLVRGFLARRGYRMLRKLSSSLQRLHAVMKLQAVARTFLVRLRLWRHISVVQTHAAVILQSLFRGALGRDRVSILRVAEKEASRDKAAAVTIQKRARARLAGKKVERRRRLKMEEQFKGADVAATKVQSLFRGKRVRAKKVLSKDMQVVKVHGIKKRLSQHSSKPTVSSRPTTPLLSPPSLVELEERRMQMVANEVGEMQAEGGTDEDESSIFLVGRGGEDDLSDTPNRNAGGS